MILESITFCNNKLKQPVLLYHRNYSDDGLLIYILDRKLKII
jgi:hypothetical protein